MRRASNASSAAIHPVLFRTFRDRVDFLDAIAVGDVVEDMLIHERRGIIERIGRRFVSHAGIAVFVHQESVSVVQLSVR